jgi:hypothetical protein
MSTSYTICGKDVAEMIKAVMDTHHAELSNAGVTVHAIFAHSYDKESGDAIVALKTRGQSVAAKIGITSLEDRTRGAADSKLTIDAYTWERLSESRRMALLDHELTHLRLKLDEDEALKLDDLGRPQLKIRHHDWEITGFQEVVERHGEASIEALQFSRFQDEYGQLMLFDPKTLGNLGVSAESRAN